MSDRKKILYLFDVDGTLTKARQIITEDFKKFLLEKVQNSVYVGLVSGSDYPKISEQMSGGDAIEKFDYVFCENGLVYHKRGKLVHKQSILEAVGEEQLQKLINFTLGYLSKIELPCKRGNFIEFRTGMINVSPVGRSCSQSERENFEKFDSVHKIREKYVEALKKEFPDLNFTYAIGGQISVDIFPTGWDKTYCLSHILPENFEEIHFFGDRTEPGGNDHEMFSDPRTIGHSVLHPEDTKKQLELLLGLKSDP